MVVIGYPALRREQAQSGRRQWVAVVDDDASVRRALARLLRSENIAVTTFATAQEFLTANVDPPACLVLDVHLGPMSGFELQQYLASVHSEIPVIFITGHDEISSVELARRVGPDAYLRKPFDGDIFLTMVRRRAQLDP